MHISEYSLNHGVSFPKINLNISANKKNNSLFSFSLSSNNYWNVNV